MSLRNPEEIFTPKTIASREMFERRNEADIDGTPGLQDNLQDALRESGGQVVLYGDTGVGKSSLLRYAAEDENLSSVTVECLSTMSYPDLLEGAIRKLADVKEIRRVDRRSFEGEVAGEGGLKWLVSLRAKLTAAKGSDRELEVLEAPLIDVFASTMQETSTRLLILDNFQNIESEHARHLTVQAMEFLSDRAAETGDVKIVVIGIAEDAPSLIGGSGSFWRRTTEIGVPRMPDDEIRAILTKGFRLLSIDVPSDVLDRLVFYSDGFPYFAHLLGLHVSRWARRNGSGSVSASEVDTALKRAVSSVHQTYSERVERAFEAGGDIQPRKSILSLLAKSDRREWKSADVISAWEAAFGKRDAYQFLHVALAALLDEKHGRLLRRKGTRGKYIYQFDDPYLRPYLRLTLTDSAA